MNTTNLFEICTSANAENETDMNRIRCILKELKKSPVLGFEGPPRISLPMVTNLYKAMSLDFIKAYNMNIVDLCILSTDISKLYYLNDNEKDFIPYLHICRLFCSLSSKYNPVDMFMKCSINEYFEVLRLEMSAPYQRMLERQKDHLKLEIPQSFGQCNSIEQIIAPCLHVLNTNEMNSDAKRACSLIQHLIIMPFIILRSSEQGINPENTHSLLATLTQLYK